MLKQTLGSVVMFSALAVLSGCGSSGGSSGGSDNSSGEAGTEMTVVDPYIQDAVLYVDENDNGVYDEGEQTSTVTGDKGVCTFIPELDSGVVIRMKSKGIHNGVPFNGSLTADFTGTGIMSPMTTLLEKYAGDTEKVITLLSNAGLVVSADDLLSDPMQGLDASSSNDDLAKLQASVAINAFLAIIGTTSDEAEIEAASASLASVVTVTKKIINATQISGDFDAGVNSAIAVANYAVERSIDGDANVLTDLSNDANVDKLMDTLKTEYINNDGDNFQIDSAVDVASFDANDIGEAKSMTAEQFFNFNGNTLNIEHHNAATHGYDARWMWYTSINVDGTSITATWTDFNWDWDDENSNDIVLEHVTEWADMSGTVSGDTWTMSGSGIKADGSTVNDLSLVAKRTIDGSVLVENLSFTENGVTDIEAYRTIFISAEKVTEVVQVNVGSADRDVYKVKYKDQYGQLDGDSFVASGEGYSTDGYECFSVTAGTPLTTFTEAWVIEKLQYYVGDDGNANLRGEAGGKIYDGEILVSDAYWEITTTDNENDTLLVRAYDDFNVKVSDGVCYGNAIGDLSYALVGVTKAEAQAIVTALDAEDIVGHEGEPEGLIIH